MIANMPLDVIPPSLAMICRLQEAMRPMPQADTPLQHHFSDGVYARELLIPAGVTVVGKLHATRHLLIVASGHVTLINGGARIEVRGPQVLETLPGTKRAIYAHEDSTLITIHLTPETDLAAIEADVILPDPVLEIEGVSS